MFRPRFAFALLLLLVTNDVQVTSTATIRDRLLFDADLLFALDEHGVRDRVTPPVALEYSF
jgi:hypothetical protein